MTDERTFRVRSGLQGGSYPEVGMTIEDPETSEDLVITAVRAPLDTVFAIDNYWEPTGGPLMLFTDEQLITARPATSSDVEAWRDIVIERETASQASLERYRRPWWRRLFT